MKTRFIATLGILIFAIGAQAQTATHTQRTAKPASAYTRKVVCKLNDVTEPFTVKSTEPKEFSQKQFEEETSAEYTLGDTREVLVNVYMDEVKEKPGVYDLRMELRETAGPVLNSRIQVQNVTPPKEGITLNLLAGGLADFECNFKRMILKK